MAQTISASQFKARCLSLMDQMAATGRPRSDPPRHPRVLWLDWLQAGLEEIALDCALAVGATALAEFHPDPADRFIVATALARSATLVKADQAILGWSGPLVRQAAGRRPGESCKSPRRGGGFLMAGSLPSRAAGIYTLRL